MENGPDLAQPVVIVMKKKKFLTFSFRTDYIINCMFSLQYVKELDSEFGSYVEKTPEHTKQVQGPVLLELDGSWMILG